MNFADFSRKHDLIELFDHLAGPELTEIAAAAAGRAFGMLLSERRKVGASLDLGLQILAVLLGRNENVAGGSFGHDVLLDCVVAPIDTLFGRPKARAEE
jgi:hypothetical protein